MTSHEKPEPLNTDSPTTLTPKVKIWDLPVRIFHWSLLLLFITAYITNALGTNYFKYHLWSGYAMIVLVSFRILWGFVGTYHARFSNFIHNPITTIKYAASVVKRKDTHYLGHNPLGAVMVVFLLSALFIQAATGLFSNDEIFNLGPLYGYINNELSLTFTSIHRKLFYWILAAVILHIIAVYLHVILKRDNIVKAMITGNKNTSNTEDRKSIHSSRIGLALVLLIALIGILSWLVYSAPQAATDLGY